MTVIPEGSVKKIHINQFAIRRNLKRQNNELDGALEPVITCKTGKSNIYAMHVDIKGPSELVYSPEKPLSCGAKVWILTRSEVVLTGTVNNDQTCELAEGA